ncbi:trypsin-like peptidase domain-containing protein [Candidatus Poribacteria bacterium]|nr:trypsin-like peptidase domain-containing protein [Candidatus Poribacteria bacterium]
MGIGYAVEGRIIAKEEKTDLAIIQLKGLPDTAREIEHNFNYNAHLSLRKKDQLQIFGNPGGLKLWKYALGTYQSIDKGMIKFTAGIYKGNSGGPVLDDQGRLIGIATLSNERHTAWAVPANYIRDLLNTLQPRHVFSITNNTTFTVSYNVKWSEEDDWDQTSVKRNHIMTHWYSGKNVPTGYPKIQFDYIANDKKVTPKTYHL